MLGGSAVHFALAASFFDDVRVVGPVGDDFGEAEYGCCGRAASTPTTSSTSRAAGPSSGPASTSTTSTSATPTTRSSTCSATSSPSSRTPRARPTSLFLANIQPDLQRQVREQCPGARFVAMDSMNLWIETARDSLLETISGVDCLMLNDDELRMLTDEPNLVPRRARSWSSGPSVGRGQAGPLRRRADQRRGLLRPARLSARERGRPDRRRRLVRRRASSATSPPTPARSPRGELLRRAMAYGTAIASYNVEEFGTERVQRLTRTRSSSASAPCTRARTGSTSRWSSARRRARPHAAARLDPQGRQRAAPAARRPLRPRAAARRPRARRPALDRGREAPQLLGRASPSGAPARRDARDRAQRAAGVAGAVRGAGPRARRPGLGDPVH